MLTDVCQRGRGWRGAGEPIRTTDYDVVRTREYVAPKRFVVETHYAGTWSQASLVCELRKRHGELAGVAVFAVVPRQYAAPFGAKDAWLCLARFVLDESVPGNGETFFLGQCFAELRREGFAGVVSYADPEPRTDEFGCNVFVGHVGSIYQGHNGVYLGRTKPETKWLLPDGTVFESRAANKVKTGDRGASTGERLLHKFGATPRLPEEDRRAWVVRWRLALCRPMFHRGNHRYTWPLWKRDRKHLPASLPYPRFTLK